MKFVGTYRVIAKYDLNTNDYPRMNDGNIDPNFDDIYISCRGGSEIYHYGKKILEVYIPSIGRGRNILKDIYKLKTDSECVNEFIEDEIFDYDKFYDYLEDNNFVSDIKEYDGELDFKFHVKDIEMIAELMKAKTSGANISPFSVKNLPKKKYLIPTAEIEEYKSITCDIPKQDLLSIYRTTSKFIYDVVRKKAKVKDVDADMKLKMIKGKDYIHSMGFFKEYLKYLKKNIGGNK